MELAKITSKGQITLPISIRRALKLKDGDKVAFVEIDGQYVLAKPNHAGYTTGAGCLFGLRRSNSLETEEDVAAMINEHRHNKNT